MMEGGVPKIPVYKELQPAAGKGAFIVESRLNGQDQEISCRKYRQCVQSLPSDKMIQSIPVEQRIYRVNQTGETASGIWIISGETRTIVKK